MKKLLSVLLIVSTLFLSLGVQAGFANWDNWDDCDRYSSSQDYEMYKLNAEIENLKKKLEKSEARKKQLKKEIETKEEKNSPSLWSKIKSKFSFLFSSYVGIGAAAVSFGALVLGISYTSMAGYECSQDDKCHFLGGSAKGHNFFNQFKKVNFSNAFSLTKDVIKNVMDIVRIVGVEDTTPKKDKN